MATEAERRLLRHFQENSVKFLLRNRENAREGLTLMAPDHAPLIDFAGLQDQPTTFIAPGFNHLENDLLLRAPMRGEGNEHIYIYQLLEHQSEPDEFATYRAIRYQMEVFDWQRRTWLETHSNTRGLLLDPVLPVIIYTGTRTWDLPRPMQALVKQGALFAKQTAALEPVFFNLGEKPAEELHDKAGLFGWVLHLMQQRKSGADDFRALLGDVVEQVEQLPPTQHGRWQDLLWYFRSMVYHVRANEEHAALVRHIEDVARSRERQEEVIQMGKTMAELLREEGIEEGRKEGECRGMQRSVLRQLREKFHQLPAGIEAQVRATMDEAKLDLWLSEILRANDLSDMSFDHPA